MPNFKAQLIKQVTPEVELEERAWNYYYKNMTCPISPMLLECIKSAVQAEEKKD